MKTEDFVRQSATSGLKGETRGANETPIGRMKIQIWGCSVMFARRRLGLEEMVKLHSSPQKYGTDLERLVK